MHYSVSCAVLQKSIQLFLCNSCWHLWKYNLRQRRKIGSLKDLEKQRNMFFLSLVTILRSRSILPINGNFSPQLLKDIFPNIPAKDKAVVFVLQKREEEYRVAKLGCRLISTLSQSYCVSYKAEMAPWEPPPILVSTLLQLHDCSGPLCFDWRRNELPLNQTVLINLFHTTNIPYFSQHSSNHTKPD